MLNAGRGFKGVFELEANSYVDRMDTQTRYADWIKVCSSSSIGSSNGSISCCCSSSSSSSNSIFSSKNGELVPISYVDRIGAEIRYRLAYRLFFPTFAENFSITQLLGHLSAYLVA